MYNKCEYMYNGVHSKERRRFRRHTDGVSSKASLFIFLDFVSVGVIIMSEALEAKNYQSVASRIDDFAKLTQIDTAVYTLDDYLLVNGSVLSGNEDLAEYFNPKELKNYTVFPGTLDAGLWGFIICYSGDISANRIRSSRRFLEFIFNQSLGFQDNKRVSVCEPLDSQQLSHMSGFNFTLNQSMSKPESVANNSVVDGTTPVDVQMPTESVTIEQTPAKQDTKTSNSLVKVLDYLHQNVSQAVSIGEAAQAANLSPMYLSRLFKQYCKVNFRDYVNSCRMAILSEKLALTSEPIDLISKEAGFCHPSYLSQMFKKKMGLTPSKYRLENGRTQKIYTIYRDLSWSDSDTVFDVSKRYFEENGITFNESSANGIKTINSIDGFKDTDGIDGWSYRVEEKQPTAPSSSYTVQGKSFVQWVYVSFAY